MPRSTVTADDLIFLPLGGLGEIGMNAALYGYGPEGKRKWILVDCGVAFAGEEAPGVDLVLPDLAFIEAQRQNLVAIIITHAHEDHIGALAELWPRLRAPVYATRFAADLLEVRRLSEPGAPKIPLHRVRPGEVVDLAPFSVEFVSMAHSIPESNALAIRTPAGLVVHSGDWKIDASPVVGDVTDVARLRALGEEGVLALISDSTNIIRPGASPSEAEVAQTLLELISTAKARVAVTIFASNVARIRSVAEAARDCGREVVVAGRAMQRVVEVATDCGMLHGLPAFRSPEMYSRLPPDKVVALVTGSQGEPRGGMARIAFDDHPEITLGPKDRVIFSSRTIPGNEKEVGRIINALVRQGIEVITDRTHMVHVSGHPRRDEVAALYAWLKPKIAIPAHGEALHLTEHAVFAREQGVEQALAVYNGQMIRLAPGPAELIDNVAAGRLYKDGETLIAAASPTIAERRKLGFGGVVSVAVAIDSKGEVKGDIEIEAAGLPETGRRGASLIDAALDAAIRTLETLGKGKRRDRDLVENALARAVRAGVGEAWGKKPTVHVLVIAV